MLIKLVKISSLSFAINFLLRISTFQHDQVYNFTLVEWLFIPAWGSIVLNLAFVGQYAFAFSLGIIVNSNQFLDQIKKEHLPVTLGTYVLFISNGSVFHIYIAKNSACNLWILFFCHIV
jgi:hypothetical protein